MAKEYIERDALREVVNNLRLGRHLNKDAALNLMERAIDNLPAADVVEVPKTGIGDLSDGYHTFNELYHHRAVLFAALCNTYPHLAWKSKKHDTGDMFEGMFIVGIETPEGQATYHYDVDSYWDMFHVKELDRAPAWDGHTPDEAIRRISTIEAEPVKHARWEKAEYNGFVRCNQCKDVYICDDWLTDGKWNYCPNCGAKMDGGAENEHE